MKVFGEKKIAGVQASRLSSTAVLVSLASAALFSGWMAYLGAPLSAEQRRPLTLAAMREYPGLYSLSPDDNARDLLCCLSSPLQASDFLQRYAHRIRHHSPVPYARGFRLSLAELQSAGWQGDCNDYANAICEIGYHHGYSMSIVSMWPSRWTKRLSDDWHQIAVLCLEPEREYLIFEYATPVHWLGTLEEYAQSNHKAILPVGGVLNWRPTKQNPVARFLDHLRSNSPPPANRQPLRPGRSDSVV